MQLIARTKLLPLLLAVACTTLPGVAAADDLMDIYRAARVADPVLAQAAAQLQQVEEGVVQARAPLLPQLSAGLSFTQSKGNSEPFITDEGEVITSGSGYTRSRTPSASLSQTIVDFSQYGNLKVSHDRLSAQEAQYEAAQQDLLIRVAQAYFDALSAEDALSFAKSRETALSRQLDQAQQRFEVGLSAITDVNEAKANHDAATADAINAQNALDDAYEALAQITGQPVHELAKLRDELPMAPPEPNEMAVWVDQARQRNPLLQAQEYQLQAAEHSIGTARAARLPTLGARVSYGHSRSWTEMGPPLPDRGSDTSVMLTLSVPIFSGFAIRSQVRQSIYRRDEVGYILEQQRRQVVSNTRSAFRAVIAGISEVEARRQAVLSAQSAVDATQAGFEVGTRNIVDVLNSQQQLFQARSAYSRARHQFIINKLQLEQFAGAINVEDLKAVNTLLVETPHVEPVATPATAPATEPDAAG